MANDARRVIDMAHYDAGLIQQGEVANTEQQTDGLARLNDMINLWQTQGLKLWLQHDLSVPLVAGQATYNLGPSGHVVMTKPLRVLDSSYYLGSTDNKIPITQLSRDDYMRLSRITQQGAVNSYFVDKQYNQLAVSLWQVPDTAAALGTVHLLIQQQAQNFAAVTDLVQFPAEWFIALRWGLADELATGQPAAIMERCQQRANAYRNALEDWDVEDVSTRFVVDPRVARIGASR